MKIKEDVSCQYRRLLIPSWETFPACIFSEVSMLSHLYRNALHPAASLGKDKLLELWEFNTFHLKLWISCRIEALPCCRRLPWSKTILGNRIPFLCFISFFIVFAMSHSTYLPLLSLLRSLYLMGEGIMLTHSDLICNWYFDHCSCRDYDKIGAALWAPIIITYVFLAWHIILAALLVVKNKNKKISHYMFMQCALNRDAHMNVILVLISLPKSVFSGKK